MSGALRTRRSREAAIRQRIDALDVAGRVNRIEAAIGCDGGNATAAFVRLRATLRR
jgi:hypothetical protein